MTERSSTPPEREIVSNKELAKHLVDIAEYHEIEGLNKRIIKEAAARLIALQSETAALQSAVAPLTDETIIAAFSAGGGDDVMPTRQPHAPLLTNAQILWVVRRFIAGSAPQSATLRISSLMSRALADTAEMLEEFAQLEKEGPRPGSGCKSRGIEVSVYDYCDAGAEQVRSFVFTDGEAEALVALIRATTDRTTPP